MKNLIITDDISKADLITHNGTFHADEVFSTVLLMNFIDKDDVFLCRTSDVAGASGIIYDVGLGEFDHHQIGGNGERENGIKFASFGLVWKKYGRKYLERFDCDVSECFSSMDKKLVTMIDAIDNGQYSSDSTINIINVSSLIGLFNSSWDEVSNQDVYFVSAVNFASIIFDKVVKSVISKVKAKCLVEEAIDKSNGIMILDNFMPYKDFIIESINPKAKDILFVVHPSNRGGYNVCTVPVAIGSFVSRKLFPSSWAGLRDKELQDVSGVSSIRFCHNARFICACETYEDALKIAEIAFNYVEE